MSFKQVLATRAPASVVLIRLIVGGVFLTEGIQKFLFRAETGSGTIREDRYPLA
jgi:uncharacterized membrane protein YphA (DoxX/SURF4 family)